jgi:hypothetical protein
MNNKVLVNFHSGNIAFLKLNFKKGILLSHHKRIITNCLNQKFNYKKFLINISKFLFNIFSGLSLYSILN